MNPVRATILIGGTLGSLGLIGLGIYAWATGTTTVVTHEESVHSGWPGIFAFLLGLVLLFVLAVAAWDEYDS